MKSTVFIAIAIAAAAVLTQPLPLLGADEASGKELKNPFAGKIEQIKEGEKIFDERCADCHGGDAMGGSGPDLTDETWIYGKTDADLFQTISGGRKGGMPSWGSQLKPEEIWKAISYVRSLSKKK